MRAEELRRVLENLMKRPEFLRRFSDGEKIQVFIESPTNREFEGFVAADEEARSNLSGSEIIELTVRRNPDRDTLDLTYDGPITFGISWRDVMRSQFYNESMGEPWDPL